MDQSDDEVGIAAELRDQLLGNGDLILDEEILGVVGVPDALGLFGREPEDGHLESLELLDDVGSGKRPALPGLDVGGEKGKARQVHLLFQGLERVIKLVVPESEGVIADGVVAFEIGPGLEEGGLCASRVEIPCIQNEHVLVLCPDLSDQGRSRRKPTHIRRPGVGESHRVAVAVVGVEYHEVVYRRFALRARLDARRTGPEGHDEQNKEKGFQGAVECHQHVQSEPGILRRSTLQPTL